MRVSDERLAAATEAHYFIPETGNVVASDLALDLRDCRAENKRLREALEAADRAVSDMAESHSVAAEGLPPGPSQNYHLSQIDTLVEALKRMGVHAALAASSGAGEHRPEEQ